MSFVMHIELLFIRIGYNSGQCGLYIETVIRYWYEPTAMKTVESNSKCETKIQFITFVVGRYVATAASSDSSTYKEEHAEMAAFLYG